MWAQVQTTTIQWTFWHMKIDLRIMMDRILKVGDVSNSNFFKRCTALDASPMLVNLVGKQKLQGKIFLCI